MRKDQYKIFGYNITSDTSFMNENFNITPEIADILQEIYPRVMQRKPGVIKELKRLCTKYPKVPQFKNLLSVAYSFEGKHKLADAVNEQILKEHPDYLFGKLNLAARYLREGNPEKVPEILGDLMEIKELYPERTTFHLAEVMGFNKLAVKYFLAVDNPELAENRIEIMEKLDADHPDTAEARESIMTYNLERTAKRVKEEKQYYRVVKSRDYDKTVQTDKKPKFIHSEIEALYTNGMRINPVILRQILALPRESLIIDLETVLQDATNRFEYFRDKEMQEKYWNEKETGFPLHALFLLAELEAENSLPAILNLLRQGEDLLEFWFEELLSETVWEVIYHLGRNQLLELKNFVKEPDNYTLARNCVCAAVEQIGMYHPERKTEVIEWFADLFGFFIENSVDDRIIDTELISFMVWDCLELRAKQLVPIIEQLYIHGLVVPGIVGTFEEVKHDIDSPGEERDKRKIFNIFSRYRHILTTWPYYTEKEDLYPERNNKIVSSYNEEKPVLAQKKIEFKGVGRNDPCPCGSGKKFKKCCLNRK